MSTIKTAGYPALALVILCLAACGGGGSGGNPATAEAPPPAQDPPTGEIPEEDPPPRQVFREFTYHEHTREIIERKCVTCHVEGDIAPFALDSYEKITQYGAAAAFAVRSGAMPPWPPTPGYTEFENDRSLTPEEKYTLLTWLENGMEEGDPADYPGAASAVATSETAEYDLSLPMSQAYTPFLQPDDHRCFAIEWPLDAPTFVTNVDILPGEKEVVHHVIVSVAEPEDAHHYYAAGGQDGRPGWYCLGAGGVSGAPLPRQIGGWVPGAGREATPEGTGIEVRPGSVVVLQMHYNTLVAEPRPDLSTVLVDTADSVERRAHGFLLTNPQWLREGGMPIPAGDPEVTHSWAVPTNALASIFGAEAGVELGDAWVMHQGFLHMHNLGVRGRTTLRRTDGSEQVILDIRDWDFNWQGTYNFVEELLIQPGDQLTISCTWDNSQQNQEFVNGEQLESRYVEWGDGTQDEMCLMSVYMTAVKTGADYSHEATVHVESPTYLQQFEPGDVVPLSLIFNNFSPHDPGEHNHEDPALHGDDHASPGDDHSQVHVGHYHVYLDTEDDDAEYVAAWEDNYYFELPEDLQPGVHELRVSLRASDHHALGVEGRIEIEVVEATAVADASLVDVNQWVEQSVMEDSLAAHRPETVECPGNSWYNEDGALEVETGYCNYLSLAQPSLVDIAAGDTLHLVLWHGDLVFDEPASAHVAVSIDGQLAWEAAVDIPAEAGIFDARVELPFDAPAGSKVEYHLHNHGFNTWTLLELERER